MTQPTEYNGWKGGYPTWCVNLWLTNDEETDEDSHAVVASAYRDGLRRAPDALYGITPNDDDQRHFARNDAADALKEYVDALLNNELIYDDRAGLGSDLQTWALGMVDWHEIVGNWLKDLDIDEDEEDDE